MSIHTKIVYVTDANIKEADIYLLTEGITYDVMSRTVWRGEEAIRLAPQAATLFLLFLHAEEHRVTAEEIDRKLWKGNGSKGSIHAAIKRLRSSLRNADLPLEIIFHEDCYLLKKIAVRVNRYWK